MANHRPLRNVRIHLSGSIPEATSPHQNRQIEDFVTKFTSAILREGGTVVHGSHPTLLTSLRSAAEPFVEADGSREALTLVRSANYATTAKDLAEIEEQRRYSVVHIIPPAPGNTQSSLAPMREWMADRCDVIVAIGGKHYSVNPDRSGIPCELEEMLLRGKPGFALGGFGGAIASYIEDNPNVFSRLRNGLSTAFNQELSKSVAVTEIIEKIVAQIKLLPIVRESVRGGRMFRILALDGGGLRGAFTAAVLAKWHDMLGLNEPNAIVKHFDLVAGTSTGAILAIGLGLKRSPLEMLDFYRLKGPSIFPKDRNLRHWLRSKYESATLRDTLASVLQSSRLQDSSCRLVIPTVRAKHGEAESIVTPHSEDRTAFRSISAVDAALASSAAPTYFDEAHVSDAVTDQEFLDGGIWANNPVLPAIAEAVRHLNVPLERIDVLNVGTMGNEADFTASLRKGKVGWVPASADLFFAAQEAAANTLAATLLTASRHLRVNQSTPTEIKLDAVEAIDDMIDRGNNVAKDSFLAVRSRFLDGFTAPDWRSDNI